MLALICRSGSRSCNMSCPHGWRSCSPSKMILTLGRRGSYGVRHPDFTSPAGIACASGPVQVRGSMGTLEDLARSAAVDVILHPSVVVMLP